VKSVGELPGELGWLVRILLRHRASFGCLVQPTSMPPALF